MKSNKVTFNSIDEYIASFPEDVQKIMEQLRSTIKAAAPEAGEKISYNMPTFTLNGTYLVYFAGWKKHVSLYPIPSGTPAYRKKISKYVAGKGTLKFLLTENIPLDIVEDTVKLLLKYKKGSLY